VLTSDGVNFPPEAVAVFANLRARVSCVSKTNSSLYLCNFLD